MAAIFCLPAVLGVPSKRPCTPLALHHHPSTRNLAVHGPLSFPRSSHHRVSCSHVPSPHPEEDKGKAAAGRAGRPRKGPSRAAVGAAVAVACAVLGAAYLRCGAAPDGSSVSPMTAGGSGKARMTITVRGLKDIPIEDIEILKLRKLDCCTNFLSPKNRQEMIKCLSEAVTKLVDPNEKVVPKELTIGNLRLGPLEIYELAIALIEANIEWGEYQKARELCWQIFRWRPWPKSEARIPLLTAFLGMVGELEANKLPSQDALDIWEIYRKNRPGQAQPPLETPDDQSN